MSMGKERKRAITERISLIFLVSTSSSTSFRYLVFLAIEIVIALLETGRQQEEENMVPIRGHCILLFQGPEEEGSEGYIHPNTLTTAITQQIHTYT